MNAFHPDYIKTFHPQFLSEVVAKSLQIEAGKANGKKARQTRESVKGVSDIKTFPKTKVRQ
jgi:hypothetical protein